MRAWMAGFVLGVLPLCLLPRLPGMVWLAPLPAVAALAGLGWRRRPWRVFSGAATGLAVALLQVHLLLQARLPQDCEGQPVALRGVVTSLPRTSLLWEDTVRQRFEFEPLQVRPVRCRGPRRLLLSYYGPQRLVPGQQWAFDAVLYRPWGLANPASFNMQAWYAESGIDGVGRVRSQGARRLPAAPGPGSWHQRLRQVLSDGIGQLALSPDSRAILRAITVADRSGIDGRLWALFQQLGVSHLLVVSGLHVGLLAGAGYLAGGLGRRLLQLAGRDAPRLAGWTALAACGTYAALAGFSLPTRRALCMLTCFILAGLLARRASAANNLLVAAVVVLLLNPLAALGSGLWLSFGAVAALLWLGQWQPRGPTWRRAPGTHAFMALAMLPLGAVWFGGSSLVAAPANLLLIPLAGLYIVPLALAGAALYTVSPALAATLWGWAALPSEYGLPVVERWLAGGEGWWYLALTPGLPEAALAVCGIALLALPAGLKLRLLGAALVIPMLLPGRGDPHGTGDSLRLMVFDVGQGTAVLVQQGRRALLYDTGGGDPAGLNMATTVILPYLRAAGIHRLDTLVVSHPDLDHSAGVGALLRVLPVDRLLYGGEPAPGKGGRPCFAGQAWRWPGGERFQVLSPAPGEALKTNDASCVLQVTAGAYRLLLAGDIEADRERELVRYWRERLGSDWLLVAHHGSRTSSSGAWLKAVGASVAVFSRGHGNRFGHPHPDVQARIRATGAAVYDTAPGGALIFEPGPDGVFGVRQWRREHPRFWM